MIDLRDSTSWHLRVIDFTMMRGHVDNLSFWGRLTTCSYIRALIFGALWVSAILATVGAAAAAATMLVILMGVLMIESSTWTWNIFVAFDSATDALIDVFGASYGLPGAIFVAVGAVFWLMVFAVTVTGAVMLIYLITSKIWVVLSDAKYARDRAKLEQIGKNPQSAQKPSAMSKIKESSTYQILHSALHKYCVPIRTSRSTQQEREAEWEKRWAIITESRD